MFSIYNICIYKGGLGATAPQKPTTHYKNKIKWRLFLYVSQDIFFFFSQARPGFFVFFLLFSETNYFFLLSSEKGYFFLSKPETGFFFLENNPGLPQNIKWSAPYIGLPLQEQLFH